MTKSQTAGYIDVIRRTQISGSTGDATDPLSPRVTVQWRPGSPCLPPEEDGLYLVIVHGGLEILALRRGTWYLDFDRWAGDWECIRFWCPAKELIPIDTGKE